MTITHPPTGEPSLDRELAQIRHLLLGLSEAATALQARLGQGDAHALRESAPLIRDLRGLVRLALDTETRFDTDRTQDRQGRAAPRLELDTARDQIGRRLDRLRATHDPGGVS